MSNRHVCNTWLLDVASLFCSGDHNNRVAAICGFGDEEDDGEHEDAEEDGADAEGPAVTVVLDDVA